MDTPLVTVLIPAYNARPYIRDAIESAFAQTYPHIEILVVDDGSTDGTGDWLREHYGERIRVVSQPNRGAAGARNAGLHLARGEFVQLCDADDQLLPDKVARSLDALREYPGATLVYSQIEQVEADGRTVIPTPHLPLPSGDLFCALLNGEQGDFVPHSTVFLRRQAVLDAGGYNESLPPCEDWDLWLRLAAAGHTFIAINEPLVLYRQHPAGMHTNRVRMAEARLKVIQLARHYPRREQCLDDAAYDRLEAGRWHMLGMVYWQTGRRADARHALRQAIRLDPAHHAIRRLYIALSYAFPATITGVVEMLNMRLKHRARR